MKLSSVDKITELIEEFGHVLDNRERLIVANILMNYRTPGQLAAFLGLPRFIVVISFESAIRKLRDECVSQMKEAGATDELIQQTVRNFYPL